EQFRVLEQAFKAPEPSAPNRVLILVLGLVFSLMAGVGVGVLREALDTSPHDARQLQTRLALPVRVSVPSIWPASGHLCPRPAPRRGAGPPLGGVVCCRRGGGPR